MICSKRNVLVLACALASYATASPFDPRVVASEAKFVAFVDVEAARKTAVGAWLLKRVQDDPKYQDFEKIMIEAAGFMPASDITDITIYGEAYAEEPDATLVIRANVDSNKLSNALSFAKGFELDSYNGHTLMSWIDEEKDRRIHASFTDDRTIVMTSSSERLQHSLDVIDDPTKALKEDSSLQRPAQPQVWAFASGADLASSPAVMKNEVLNGLLSRGKIECSEDGGKSSITLAIETETADQAQQALNAANGLKAVVQIAANRRGDVPEQAKLGAELAAAATLTAQANTVAATLSLENEKAIQTLERAIQLKQ